MTTQRLLPIAHLEGSETARKLGQSAVATFESIPSQAIAAARARISTAARESRRRKLSATGTYYGTTATAQPEETLDEFASESIDAIVTRNHYGCLVLNAARTLFIDVDFVPANSECQTGSADRRHATWETMLDDLCLVLAGERDLGFRVYCTRAGFRLLATNREFEPHSRRAEDLMKAVSADEDFIKLCRLQRNFRARLTPKPWRCGAKRPPNSFPRESADDQRAFSQWLSGYEDACRDRATCRLLGHVGRPETHRQIAPIIELHDRQTKALESLPLA